MAEILVSVWQLGHALIMFSGSLWLDWVCRGSQSVYEALEEQILDDDESRTGSAPTAAPSSRFGHSSNHHKSGNIIVPYMSSSLVSHILLCRQGVHNHPRPIESLVTDVKCQKMS